MHKSLEQIRRDADRYVKLKDLKLPKLACLCKFYRKLFLKLKDKVQETQLRQLKLISLVGGGIYSRDRIVRETGRLQ